MNIVLLSGGSGKRLWPLSNDIRSKQFIKIFKNSDNTYSSMVQLIIQSCYAACKITFKAFSGVSFFRNIAALLVGTSVGNNVF